MENLFFQGRGTAALRLRDVNGNLGPVKMKLCTDALAIKFAISSWEHINKCGPVDAVDTRGTNSVSAEINLTLANMADNVFALGSLGIITPASVTASVVDEQLPTNIEAGDSYFLGGKERHRNITALVITGAASTADYTLDAATGEVTFITDQSGSPGPTASYSHTDPAAVSLLAAPVLNYAFDYEFINKQNANKKGSFELYNTRFDPTDNLDLQSDKEQDMTLKGSVLLDPFRDAEVTEFGQFGRRVL